VRGLLRRSLRPLNSQTRLTVDMGALSNACCFSSGADKGPDLHIQAGTLSRPRQEIKRTVIGLYGWARPVFDAEAWRR